MPVSVVDYGGSSGAGAVILDDCNFHESVHLDSFEVDRTLSLVILAKYTSNCVYVKAKFLSF